MNSISILPIFDNRYPTGFEAVRMNTNDHLEFQFSLQCYHVHLAIWYLNSDYWLEQQVYIMRWHSSLFKMASFRISRVIVMILLGKVKIWIWFIFSMEFLGQLLSKGDDRGFSKSVRLWNKEAMNLTSLPTIQILMPDTCATNHLEWQLSFRKTHRESDSNQLQSPSTLDLIDALRTKNYHGRFFPVNLDM